MATAYDHLFVLDRSVFSIGTVGDDDYDDTWLHRSPAERLASLEFLRTQFFGDAATRPPFQRVLEVAQRD